MHKPKTALTVRKNKLPVKFKPQETKNKVSKADALIKYATDLKDWSLLDHAVDAKIAEINDFVAWWKENVRTGGNQPSNADPRLMKLEEVVQLTGVSQQQIVRWRKRLEDKPKFRAMLMGPVYRKAFGDASQLNQQSISNEHYTPKIYIEAARKVLGVINLDPASCAEANRIVKAKTYYKADGLEQQWSGHVWLNPPYGNMAGAFIEKLTSEIKSGSVTSAIVLVNAHCTDTAWFQPLWGGVLCFTNHRINFYGDDTRSGSTHGSVFVYFGKKKKSFADTFRKFGAIVERV